MLDSSHNTIETVNTLVEALRYASNLVDSTDGQVAVTYQFLSTYDYFGTIFMTVPSGKEIEVPLVDILSPNISSFYSYTVEDMSSNFYLKTDMATSGNNIVAEVPGVADGLQMLSREMLLKHSLVAGGRISIPTAYYADSVIFDAANDDDDTVIPLSVVRSEYYTTNSNIPISDSDWEIYVKVNSVLVTTPIGKEHISISNAEITKEILTSKVKTSSPAVSFSELLRGYVGPEMEIDSTSELPETLMDGTTNMLTGRDIRKMPMFKAGATVSLKMKDKMSDFDLKQLIDDYFVSSNYFAVYEGVDQMLTQDQVEILVDHIVKKVLSIDDSGLQI